MYDRVHVGAACPPNKVVVLRKLLKPSGGIIVTPVAPSDLQRITVNAEGHVRIETLSQVRYSNLEVSCSPRHRHEEASLHCLGLAIAGESAKSRTCTWVVGTLTAAAAAAGNILVSFIFPAW